eukprot:TRINITY_DN852_c0_g1_i2.p1 TRINITY_DN852_c0_g1~~TRINITY_DN852_c0_g1_i2.p1  ORF type:complete len:854 (-),score=186.32 TRINITY_DN852_c0_g1_i2:1242-3803(-)
MLDKSKVGKRPNYRKYFAPAFLILASLFFLRITYSQFRAVRFIAWNPKINEFCRCHPEDPSCVIPQELQFDKFIWVVTDGLPANEAPRTIETFGASSPKYVTWIKGPKWSHAVYTMWMSGVSSTNFFGEAIQGDQLYASLARANTKCGNPPSKNGEFLLRYVGPEWCFLSISGGAQFGMDHFFNEIQLVGETEYKKEHIYPSLAPPGALESVLEDVANKKQSLIIHTGILDKKAHFQTSMWKEECKISDEFNLRFKSFADSHPEYLLILSSDHGISDFGGFHGSGLNGNIGFMIFYNQALQSQPHGALEQIDVVDVPATVSKYLKGVDIPANSHGMARNYYNSTVQADVEKKILQQSAHELRELAMVKEVNDKPITMPSNGKTFDSFLDKKVIDYIMKPSTHSRDVSSFVLTLKEAINNPPETSPLVPMACVVFLAGVVLWMTIKRLTSDSKLLIGASVGALVSPCVHFWFVHYHYLRDWHGTGTMQYIWFALVVAFYLIAMAATLKKENINRAVWGLLLFVPISIMLHRTQTLYFPYATSPVFQLVSIGATTFSLIRFLSTTTTEKRLILMTMTSIVTIVLTRSWKGLYFLNDGFHVCVLFIFFGVFAFFGYGIVKRNARLLMLGYIMWMAFVRVGDPHILLLTLFFTHKFGVSALIADTEKDASHKEERKRLDTDVRAHSLFPSISAINVTLLCVCMAVPFVHLVSSGRVINLDVEVTSAVFGLQSWNTHPTYAGVIMLFEKLGTIFLCMFLIYDFASKHKLARQMFLVLYLSFSFVVSAFFYTSFHFTINHGIDEVFMAAALFGVLLFGFSIIACIDDGKDTPMALHMWDGEQDDHLIRHDDVEAHDRDE